MRQSLRLLLVEDSALDTELTLARLDAGGYRCDATVVDNEADFLARLETQTFDVILADFVLPVFSGTEALALARERVPDTPFVFVSGVLGEEHAVEMLKKGATDYVLKQRLQRLPAVVQRALTERDERRQRILAERTLRERETHFRLVIDALKDYAVITLDRHGLILTWNAASERILGYTAEDVIGRSGGIFFDAGDRASGVFAAELEAAAAHGSVSDDRWLWDKDGRSFFASAVTTAMRDEQGQVVGFSKIIRDATQAQMAADALKRAKEQAETANRAKDHFLAVLSHELRTPLTPILAAVRLIQLKDGIARELSGTLDVIRRNVELEARLIDDLLDLTSIARGKLSLNFQRVDLGALAESAIEMSAQDIETKGLHLSIEREAQHSLVMGDAARLQQIIWNIMKNAVKFTPAGGAIAVRIFNPTPTDVAVAVTDSGIGIGADALPRIFSAFEQGDASIGRAFGGLGLGLAIARTLAQKHGGVLRAESAGPGRGASFTLTLPLLEASQGVPPDAWHDEAAAAQGARALKILLVEDNEYTCEAMSQLLEVLGHEVVTAANVALACEAIDANRFDVLVSDIGLPDGSGIDVVRRWRQMQADAPAIAITGYGMDDDVRRCRDAGFSSHLTKPINFDRLEALLKEVASGAGDPPRGEAPR